MHMHWNNAHIRQGYLICIYLHRLPWQVSALGFVRVTPNPNHDIVVSYFVYSFKYIPLWMNSARCETTIRYFELFVYNILYRIDIEWNIDLQLTWSFTRVSIQCIYYIEHDKKVQVPVQMFIYINLLYKYFFYTCTW